MAAAGGITAGTGGIETSPPNEYGDVRPQSGTLFRNKPFASFSQQRSAVLPTYTLRRFSRPAQGWYGPTDDIREVEAADDGQAVLIAQAVAAEPDSDLLAIELRDADERMVWSLMRGETISHRPSEAP